MSVGDLVRYCEGKPRGRKLNPNEELGIITALGKWNNQQPECHVIWFTCDNEGWWNSENLEVVSATTG